MKKVTLLILLILMTAPVTVSPSDLTKEQTKVKSSQQIQTYFATLPKNPMTIEKVTVYKDPDLTQAIDQIDKEELLEVIRLRINQKGLPIFQLKNGSYLLASTNTVQDDVPRDHKKLSKRYWLKPDFTVYDSPYTRFSQLRSTNLSAYSQVKITASAKTQAGLYYQIAKQGWISEKDLSEVDNRMEKVQLMLTQKYNKSNYSIYVKQVATQKSAGINPDMTMYSASISKLPVLYAVQDALDAKKITLSTRYRYTDKVNQFPGAYDPSGSGEMSKTPDGKTYTVKSLIQAVTKHSDNVASNMLAYYVTDQFGSSYQALLTTLGITWDMSSRDVSAKTAALVMEALYQQNGYVLKNLSKTDFDDQRIAKNIPVRVAHKIGDAYDYKHDVAVVYADSPFILSVFTNDATYDDITAIADDVYAILN